MRQAGGRLFLLFHLSGPYDRHGRRGVKEPKGNINEQIRLGTMCKCHKSALIYVLAREMAPCRASCWRAFGSKPRALYWWAILIDEEPSSRKRIKEGDHVFFVVSAGRAEEQRDEIANMQPNQLLKIKRKVGGGRRLLSQKHGRG
jgi:hypothetical protein